MSATNGQRARFHRNRKRRVLRNMKSRALMAELKSQPGTDAGAAATKSDAHRAGPAKAAK